MWKLNKGWLMRVPCFSLVVERLIQQPQSGMERFLVKVALAMQPEVFVPAERPPALRLYIITEGVSLYRGHKITKGDSWGADDVLMKGRSAEKCFRALAVTYVHVLWIGLETFDALGVQHRVAYNLTKLWAVIHAAGEVLLHELRDEKAIRTQVQIGEGPGQFTKGDIERRMNNGSIKVDIKRTPEGKREVNSEGQTLYGFRYRTIDLLNSGYEINRLYREVDKRTSYYLVPIPGHPALAGQYGERSMPARVRGSISAAAGHNRKSLLQSYAGNSALAQADASASQATLAASAPLAKSSSDSVTASAVTASALAAQLSALTARFQAQTASQNAMNSDLTKLTTMVDSFAKAQPLAGTSSMSALELDA